MLTPAYPKSTYLIGKQCHLRLWHDFHVRHLASPSNEAQQLIFDTGHEVGELACRRYPGGHLVAHDHHHVSEALAETQGLIEANTAPAEAAFEHRRPPGCARAAADVLARSRRGCSRSAPCASAG